jgi:putative Ig domain-containing protein
MIHCFVSALMIFWLLVPGQLFALTAAPLTQLSAVSDRWDRVGNGQSYSIGETDGTWTAYGSDYSHDGLIDTVNVTFSKLGSPMSWTFEFSTFHMNQGLVPGFYDKVDLSILATPGRPSMNIGGPGGSCDALTGNFTIIDAQFESTGLQRKVLSLAVQFEQHCRGNPPAVRGLLFYKYVPPIRPIILTRSPESIIAVGRPFSLAFTAIAGIPPYFWAFSGGNVPSGLALKNDGLLDGTPTAAGEFSSTIRVTDSAGQTAQTDFVLRTEVRDTRPPVTELSMVSDAGDYVGLGKTYLIKEGDIHFTTQAITPKFAYISLYDPHLYLQWSLFFSTEFMLRDLVPGFYDDAMRWSFQERGHPGMDVTGESRGCNEITGNFTILEDHVDRSSTVPVLVSFGAVFEQHCEGHTPALRGHLFYNYEEPLHPKIVSFSPLPEAELGNPYNQALVASGGQPPYTWSFAGGTLPLGLTLRSDGKINGIPGSGGTFPFSVRAADSLGSFAESELSIGVISPLTISSSVSLPRAIQARPYVYQLMAAGGTPPYSWILAEGEGGRQLPLGLTINSQGFITGIPIVSSAQFFALRVTDALGRVAENEFKLEVRTLGGALGVKQLTMSSEGEYVGRGLNYFYGDHDGNWNAYALDNSGDGLVDDVRIRFSGSPGDFWGLSFSTTKLGEAMVRGTYDGVQGFLVEQAGHPGMDISGQGRSCNVVSGKFTVLDAKFDYALSSPRLISFAATFEQYCEGGTRALRGEILYGYAKRSESGLGHREQLFPPHAEGDRVRPQKEVRP